jgi:hypothetical protein
MRWVGHVAHIRKMKMGYKTSVRETERKGPPEGTHINGRKISNWMRIWIRFTQLRPEFCRRLL